MLTQLVNIFVGLSAVDQWLLIILGISLVLKLLRGFSAYCFTWYLEHNKGTEKCKFLTDNGKTGRCDNVIFNKTHFKDHGEICKNKKCPGYRSVGIKTNEIIQTHWVFSVLSLFSDWGIQLPSVILIVRTLLEVKSQ